MTVSSKRQTGIFPFHGWIGCFFVALFWLLNWLLPGNRTIWGFFPLWFGYSLAVDALVYRWKGNSLLTRSPLAWAGLFFVSAPVWWLFELLNLRTQNWFYLGTESLSTFQYALFSTWSFSTVMPAVFGTAELVGTWKPLAKLVSGPFIPNTPAFLNGLLLAGVVMLALLVLWPDVFFPLLWVSLFLIIEPLNVKLGNRSLLADLFRGDWRTFFSLALGALICGFFWEMWNFYSFPKWIYRIPYANWVHVFEMPLAGYLGYIPFSFELFSLFHLLTMPLRKNKLRSEILPIQ
ncbi:MAG: hypothetical protein M0P74_13100 [Syntrophales bacterium]|jgi:hypothetical protein|nr:hypothetical protein [Syntrophales bacterium]